MSKWYILSPFKLLVQELVLLPNYWQFFSQVLLKISKNLVFVAKLLAMFASFLGFPGQGRTVENWQFCQIFAKVCRYFSNFAKISAFNSLKNRVISATFGYKFLATIAKKLAKGKNVTQIFGNVQECSNPFATVKFIRKTSYEAIVWINNRQNSKAS